MTDPWWLLRPRPSESDHLNEQQYDAADEPQLVEVVSRRDPLTGDPVEWVYCHPDAVHDWRV